MNTIYRVYLTTYKGNMLPLFYIGSSTEKRLLAGYHGSITSQKYSKLWKEELRKHPDLFSTRLLSKKFYTHKEALEVEARLQIKLKVVRSPLYTNMSVAQKNGCFGRDISGENHPLYKRGHTEQGKKNISLNHADVSGEKNGRAECFKFTSPVGEVTEVFGGFKKFCKEHGLPVSSACFLLQGRVFTSGGCKGWLCEKVNPSWRPSAGQPGAG